MLFNNNPHLLTVFSHLANWNQLKTTVDGVLKAKVDQHEASSVLDFLGKATSILEPRWPLIRRIFISRGLTIGLGEHWFKLLPGTICLHHNKRGNFKCYLRRIQMQQVKSNNKTLIKATGKFG